MTIDYGAPYWNPTLPPPPGFAQNPWETFGSPPGNWTWENSVSSPWNWDGHRPLPPWNWETQGSPPPWGPSPYSFGNAGPPHYPPCMPMPPYFHQPPPYPPNLGYPTQTQGFVPPTFNGTSPPDGIVPPSAFPIPTSAPGTSGSGSSHSGGSWSEPPSDVGEGNTGGTMQMPAPTPGNHMIRGQFPGPGLIPVPNYHERLQNFGRGTPGSFGMHSPNGAIPRGARGSRSTPFSMHPNNVVASMAATFMSFYGNNAVPPSVCGPSSEALLLAPCSDQEDESVSSRPSVGVFTGDMTGPNSGRQAAGGNTEKGQGDRMKPGYRILRDMSVTHVLCSICCKKNGRLCTACGRVAYCGVKCQKADWDNHKQNCKPAAIADKRILLEEKNETNSIPDVVKAKSYKKKKGKPNEINEKYNGKLMARRKIQQGENVLHLQPVMMACNDKGLVHPPDSVLCLTCCKWYQSSQGYRCSKCRWPVCSLACEKNSLHSKYECSVFSSNKVIPPTAVDHTQFFDDAILALRCLLLKKEDPSKFEELFEWKGICSQKKRTSTWALYDQRIVTFLTERCGVLELLDIKAEELPDYLKVVDFCSLMVGDRVVIHANEFGKSFFCAKYVFPSKFLVTEECSPNCKWSIKHSTNLEDCSLRLHSTLNIEAGAYLTASFSKLSDFGASFPRRYNTIRFDTICDCRRCKDPTELGSFFSGVKCQECDGENGYLLPTNPSNPTSEWNCHNSKCNTKMKGSFIIQDINRIHNEMDEAGNDYWALVDLIWKYERHPLHPNHFLILKAATVCVELFWGSVRGLPFYSPRYDFFNSCINLANRAITILDIISPGASIQRARILFQIQVAHAYKNLRDFRRYLEWGDGEELKCIPKIFWEVQKIQEEAFGVLQTEPYGSLEHEMSVVLQEVIEDQVDLLCHTPTEVPLEHISIYNLHKIYSRFSNEFYYPAIPIYEDKDIHDFVISTGSCARHLVEKINYTM